MESEQKEVLTVFYDGSCIVCSRELEKYRKMDSAGRLKMVDITAPTFDPSLYDRDLQTFMAKLHVLDNSGEFHTGVDAFTRIWRVLPQSWMHLLSTIIAFPGIRLLARTGYWAFAHVRKFLPKVSKKCDDDSCRIK
jgi:predicted DCC family thiol-disulfide oxidoreductase YuxK